jgi:hypothetical protein
VPLAPAVIAVLLAAAQLDASEVPLPPPPPGTTQQTRVPPSSSAAAPTRPVRFAGTFGFDFGFTDLLKVELTDGSSRSITANQGMFLALGVVVPYADGLLETQATVGLKYSGIQASNGSADYLVFPIEVLEAVNVAPFRLAAGLVYVPEPRTSGSGVLSEFDVHFESSVGLVLQGEWVFSASRSGTRFSFGPRFVLQKLQVRGGGPVIDANALGAVLSFTL